ncbi:MAG: hypothetical protein H6828_08245 [Planctomycetes bacterium]|nr:hypothetical protein [Planctomycetota bacterium]
MHSSPAAPSGTSRSASSHRCTRVPSIGWPSVTGAPGRTSARSTTTVASVGPYPFTRRRPRDQRAATSAGSASPPTYSSRSAGSARAGSAQAIARSSVGGGPSAVIPSRTSHGTRSGPRRTTSSSSTTDVAPAASASQVSSSDES